MKKLSIIIVITLVLGLFSGAVFADEHEDEDLLWNMINADESEVETEGRWQEMSDDDFYDGLEITTDREGASVEVTFTGSAVRWYSSTGNNGGISNVYLDDELVAEDVASYRDFSEKGVVIFEKMDLEPEEHVLRIEVTGEKHDDAFFPSVNVDSFGYIPTLESVVEENREDLDEANIQGAGPQYVGDMLESYNLEDDSAEFEEAVEEAEGILEDGDGDVEEAIINIRKAKGKFEDSLVEVQFPDLSGNENHGYVRSDGDVPVWAPGRGSGRAVLFGLRVRGENARVEVPDDPTLDIEDEITVSAWFYSGSFRTPWGQIIDKGDSSYQIRRFARREALTANLRNGGDLASNERSGVESLVDSEYPDETRITDHNWHFVATTFDREAGVQKLYVNGYLAAEEETSDESIAVVDNPVWIGGNELNANREWDGAIDEVRLWNKALDEEEIKENMDQQLSGDEEGLVGYWTFDQTLEQYEEAQEEEEEEEEEEE